MPARIVGRIAAMAERTIGLWIPSDDAMRSTSIGVRYCIAMETMFTDVPSLFTFRRRVGTSRG
jgi:hypothetical protein